MKSKTLRWILALMSLVLAVLLTWTFLAGPKDPTARVRVVDAKGKPIAGVAIAPQALRTKPGPYQAGWYRWSDTNHMSVTTDANGYADISYPKFVFEKIETGVVIFKLNHPDFVPDSVERVASTKPPAGTPWRLWRDYLLDRIQHRQLLVPVEPVTLKRGAILEVEVEKDPGGFKDGQLFVQVANNYNEGSNYWQRPEPGKIVTKRLGEGHRVFRLVGLDGQGAHWFSEITNVDATAEKTNYVTVKLARGATLRGVLDTKVLRPVTRGRAIIHVWPSGLAPSSSPPEWHAWANIRDDGSFEIAGLPTGDLEVVAICDGYVSTNGPGKFKMRYPQQHQMSSNDLNIVVGMEPTARLEVQVTDMQGKPVKDATISGWPNVRYGEWSAVVFGEDCYNTADRMLKPEEGSKKWQVPADFSGKSDDVGIAVLPNLPVTTREIAVDHPTLTLPAVADASGQKRRQSSVTLTAGVTNHLAIRLEPAAKTPIKHY